MLSLNVLLSLIIQAKRKGKGIVPNGKIYTSLMLCVSDFGGENEVLTCFNNETVAKESYRKLERFLSRFQRDGKGYPYELFSFGQLENSVGDTEKMAVYPRKMEKLCSSMLAAEKLDALTYTLLEALRQDSKIRTVLYGCEVIPKEKLLGSYAHPKRICIEALLVGMLYHVHKHPSEAERIELLECPDKRTFQTVHFGDNNSLELGLTISQNENIRLNAKRQKPEKLRYQLEFRYDETVYTELPKTGNMFIYGTGGVGKTSVLKSLVSDEETVYFYFPLYQYRAEVHENFSRQNIWILLNILLKYHYQYEYAAYEVLAANVGEENILQQLNELEKMLCSIPVSKKISTILLDAFNEIPTDEQSGFVRELEHIMDKWKNVRIVVAGRTVPQYDVFREFKKAEITGITKTELSNQLKGSTANEQMLEILRIPLFLNLYLSDIGGKRTKGELLDSYFMSRQGDDVIRFIVMFSLPLIGKEMSGAPVCSEITRADALKAVNKSMKLYLNDQYVYQNYIAPRKINKKVLQESRKSDDWIELILSRTGIMAVSECDPNKLHFAHE